MTRFESHHEEMLDASFDGFRRTYRSDGTILEERVEANADEVGRSHVVIRRDERRRVVHASGDDGTFEYRYDERGRLTGVLYGSRPVAQYVWVDDHLVEEREGDADGTSRPTHSFTLDDAGRLIERIAFPTERDADAPVERLLIERDASGHVRGYVVYEGDRILERERCRLDAMGRARTCSWDYLDDGEADATTTFEYGAEYGAFPCTVDVLPEVVRDDRP